MDANDFQIPSPKRQRTESPIENRMIPLSSSQNAPVADSATVATPSKDASSTQQPVDVSNTENSMLDTLMQQIEAESTSDPLPAPTTTSLAEQPSIAPVSVPTDHAAASSVQSVAESAAPPSNNANNGDDIISSHGLTERSTEDQNISSLSSNPEVDTTMAEANIFSAQVPVEEDALAEKGERTHSTVSAELQAPREPGEPSREAASEIAQAAAMIDGIPPSLETAQLEDTAEGAEWEVDSSPYESSSDSDTSSDDSSDEDADGDYAMLDPEEQARILMQGDGGSDDEGDKTKNKSENAGLKTANEQAEDVLPIPDVKITEDMKVEELGDVEGIVDKVVLIKAKVSGEYQVLDSGSLICLQDRRVAGVVAELLGRVEQPMYMVRFRSEQEIEERGLSQKGTTVYYVPSHSTFVFTQPLKAIKGSDASNFHDEEVGDDEMEFSDDEQEAEHKRNLKLKRQGRAGEIGRGRGSGRGSRGGQRGGRPGFDPAREANGAAYGNGSLEMNYDDVNDGEEGYTPLARPTNLHEMMGSAQPVEPPGPTMLPPFTQQARGRGRGARDGQSRGRGDRGRGRGNNNNRGASNPQNRQSNDRSQFQGQPQYPNQASNAYQQQQQPPQSLFPFPPPPPMLGPQSSGFPGSLATSPMSPLPNQQFNFSNFQPSQSFNPAAFQQQFQQQQQQYQQQQHQQNAYYNPSGMQGYAPPQQQYPQQQPQQQQPNGSYQNAQGGWQNNQAAIAEVQRQLEQMRRSAGGGQQ